MRKLLAALGLTAVLGVGAATLAVTTAAPAPKPQMHYGMSYDHAGHDGKTGGPRMHYG